MPQAHPGGPLRWISRPGTSRAETVRITTRVSKELRSIPGVRNFGAHIGQGTLADEPVGVNFAENWISIDPKVDYDKTVAAIQKVVDGYPGLQRDVQTYLRERTKETLSGSSEAIVVRISGDDLGVLRQKAEEVQRIDTEAQRDAVFAIGGKDEILLAERASRTDLRRLLSEARSP